MSRYYRSMTFPASHFNGEPQYVALYEAIDKGTMKQDWSSIFLATHGHDFMVEIEVDAPLGPQGYAIADEDIEAAMAEFINSNHSILPRFMERRERATTERVAEAIAQKIALLLPRFSKVRVKLWEDRQRHAICEMDAQGEERTSKSQEKVRAVA